MTLGLKPQGRRWTMREVTQWADEWISNHGANYASGLAAAHGAELTIRATLAVERVVIEHDVEVFRQEIVLSFNRAAQAEDRRSRGEWLVEFQAAGAR